ncbi:MAG: hypothetical protein Q8L48_18050 [Archangium sp.]|nr:hypothetical protein [Archangium sp.]
MTRRFAPQTQPARPVSPSTLGSRLTTERLPLDLALSLAVEVVDAVAAAHQQRRSFGQLTATDFVVQPDGTIAVTAPSVISASTDTSADTFAVGAVLYQLFTGFTPNQARARLAVSPLHEVPLASRINPAIDDTMEGLLSMMLDRDPARRPHSLRVIEALLIDVCESMELEPSRAAILHWATVHPEQTRGATLRVVPQQLPPPPPAARHRPSFVVLADEDVVALDDDEEVEAEAEASPLRFDMWAVAACAFCVVAFAMATQL